MRRVVILHTNDLHNHLDSSAAEKIRALKEAEQDSLLLDGGDAISAGNIYFRPGGEPVLELMSRVGYDAMALGNREFHFLQMGLKAKLSSADFPVLSANLRPTKEGADLLVQSHILRELGSAVKVAVLGLTVPMITTRMLSQRVSSYVFDDPVEVAGRLAPDLKRKADILVALTHIGLRVDRELAEAVPEIDLIIGGHSHDRLQEPEFVGRTAVVQAGWNGHYVGRVEIEIGPAEPFVVSAGVISLRE